MSVWPIRKGGNRVTSGPRITLRDLYLARARVAPWIRRTPLVASPSLSALGGARISLKLETAQDTGAFKLRGATNFIRASGDTARSRGVVTVSTGNHGRAVAQAARRVGARAVVCMSELVPDNKREAIGALGAETRIVGQSQDEAELEARRLAAEEGLALVHPFDDPLVIAGQGTIGIEILEDRPEVDTVIAGLSGGGLISGIAVALKAANPRARVVGVTMEHGAAMYESLRAGHPVEVEETALARRQPRRRDRPRQPVHVRVWSGRWWTTTCSSANRRSRGGCGTCIGTSGSSPKAEARFPLPRCSRARSRTWRATWCVS